jgi:hypothetical protein
MTLTNKDEDAVMVAKTTLDDRFTALVSSSDQTPSGTVKNKMHAAATDNTDDSDFSLTADGSKVASEMPTAKKQPL